MRGRLVTVLRDIGFTVPDSQANFVWGRTPRHAVRPIYEELKRRRILIRYMDVSWMGRRPADNRGHGCRNYGLRGALWNLV